MAEDGHVRKRKPLGDGSQSANIIGTKSQSGSKPCWTPSPSTSALPHHESLMPNGPLTVQNITNSPENKRLSAVTSEVQNDSKRDSQISNTSTNASSNRGARRKTHIGPWELGRDIGQGHSCKVRKVRHTITGQHAAVKIIDKKAAEKARSESLANLSEMARRPQAGSLAATSNMMPFGIEREIVILKLLEHPNVIKLYDIWENRNQLYLVMEYVDGGELFDYVADQERLAEDETVWLFRQIAAALLHCHSLGIHHRDLKPENILIDTVDDSLRVKLADFGMAALQPRGKQLTTACGSVHYAAPEVFERRYDGSRADVWSLGVILYVMLTGTTPFNYDQRIMANDVGLWYNVIKSGIFTMPDELSNEAKDLLTKMLRPDPRHRITLENVWDHPFIHKYESDWGETKESGNRKNWIGPDPVIEAWDVKTKEDIDREIFRNLRTLWHSEKEETLIERILSEEPNQEKFFYFTLQRHREEQLENYVGSPDSMVYAPSDYHHLKTNFTTPPATHAAPAVRTKSQFSILNDEHLRSRESLHEPPSSVKSYDPFRASRYPITTGTENNYTSVVVHRRSSQQSKHSDTTSLRKPTSLRVESLRRSQQCVSTASGCGSPKFSTSRYSKTSARSNRLSGRSISRSSMGSSLYTSSSPLAVKASAKHKRPVDFSHISKSLSSRRPANIDDESMTMTAISPRKEKSCTSLSHGGMAKCLSSNIRVEKRATSPGENTKASSKELGRSNLVIESEARKVSTQLEKFCEEAFNRSSAGSSHQSSATISQTHSETPPSSISRSKSVVSIQDAAACSEGKFLSTPASAPPTWAISSIETPNTFIARELAETKKRFAARYAHDHNLQTDNYFEVLAHLDSLIKPALNPNRRSTSAPGVNYGNMSPQLPMISEDQLLVTDAESEKLAEVHYGEKGTVTARVDHLNYKLDPGKSIRVVDETSPPRPAPLVIRKVSKESMSCYSVDGRAAHTKPEPSATRMLTPPGRNRSTSPKSLETIREEQPHSVVSRTAQTSYEGSIISKRKNWWRRNHSDEEVARHVGKGEDRCHEAFSPDSYTNYPSKPENTNEATYICPELSGRGPGKKPSFFKFFGRKRSSDVSKNLYLGHSQITGRKSTAVSILSPTSSTMGSNHALDDRDCNDSRDLGVQQHWLARILHIKPAMRILCFQVTRGKARAEITRLLRSWRPHGMRDVILDRDRNLVFGRLDAINALGFKEVEFVAEIFVVLDKGKRKGLSIARFVQRKGAASSFKRVVEEVGNRLTAKGMLIMEKETRKEMEALLT